MARLLAPTPIFDDLRYLVDNIGGRPTGSTAMDAAMQWSVERFIDAGLSNAHLDPYTSPNNWLPKIERGVVINKNKVPRILRLAAIPYSSSTPSTGLTAPVYAISAPEVTLIKSHRKAIKGHWLLIPISPMHSMDDLFKEYITTLPLFTAAKQAGAVGVLWLSNRPARLLYRHNATMDGTIVPLPAAVIEREGGEHIMRSLKAGEPVTVKAILQNVVQENPRNYNVVAEIKGSEKPDEVIILGAHLDSWDLGQGALDNGSNVVLVLDVARQLAALQKQEIRSSRTIRFMLYSGEELGLYGSQFDVKNHIKDLDTIKSVIIYDIGTGRTTGFSLGGRTDMQDLVDHMLQPINSLGPFKQTTDAFIGTDNFDYLLKGIPTLVANQDPLPYLPSYHAESDTLDKVDSRELKLNSIIAAILTWNLANTQETIPPRQTETEINRLLKSTGVEMQMKVYNIWEDFMNNRR